MRSNQTYVIAFLSALCGLLLFGYKSLVLQFPLMPNQKAESWHIEAKLQFDGAGEAATVNMFLPKDYPGFSMVDENFVSTGYGLMDEEEEETGNRVGIWSKREAEGQQMIFYRAVVYESSSAPVSEETGEVPMAKGLHYQSAAFRSKAETSPTYMALRDLIEELQQKSSSEKTFAGALVTLIQKGGDERITRLREDKKQASSPEGLVAYVLNTAGIPAVVVNGIALEEHRRDANIRSWVNYYADGEWHVAAPFTDSKSQKLKLFPWWQGTDHLFRLEGGAHPSLHLGVKRHVENELTEAIWQGDTLSRSVYGLSVFSLPIDTQLLFHILLLFPVGTLVLAFLRQVIGVKTFGTFMPVLVALAFRETQLIWGIIWFIVIVGTGLVFRAYFDKLKLLLVPRLCAVLTIVVLLIYLLSLASFKFGISSGLSISLFPIVILTMVIERMSLTWEEYGARQAIRTCIGSLFAAVIAYLAMNNELVSYWFITFPELLLLVLALALLLGRYNGYKLTEYKRFRMLKDAL